MKKLFFTIIITMLIVEPSARAAEPAQPLRSGMYEGLVPAVSPTGRAAGHFNVVQSDNPTTRCVSDFAGRVDKQSDFLR